MTADDLKQIEDLVTKSNRPIKELVEVIKHKVDNLDLVTDVTVNHVRSMREQLSVVNTKLDYVTTKLDKVEKTQIKHTGSLLNIEQTLESYADRYKINTDNMKKLQTRMIPLEKKAGLNPDSELAIIKTY